MWPQRAKALLAMLMIGEGSMALCWPHGHLRLWRGRTNTWNSLIDTFDRHPHLTQTLAAMEIAAGIWLGWRQIARSPQSRRHAAMINRRAAA